MQTALLSKHLDSKLLVYTSLLLLPFSTPSRASQPHSLAFGVFHLLNILLQGCQQNTSRTAITWWRKIHISLLIAFWHSAPLSSPIFLISDSSGLSADSLAKQLWEEQFPDQWRGTLEHPQSLWKDFLGPFPLCFRKGNPWRSEGRD